MMHAGRYHHLPRKITDDYDLTDSVLGDGINGDVKMAVNKLTKEAVAVKVLPLVGTTVQKQEAFRSEAEVLLSADHPNIVRLADVYESEDSLHIVMECLVGDDMYARVKESGRLGESEAAPLLMQMLLALNYLHSQGIVHRDLKVEHFMYDSATRSNLKLIDFGHSRRWRAGTDGNMKEMCGTAAYAAPELLKKDYTSQVDLWALGVVAFILILGYMPWPATPSKESLADLLRGNYTQKPERWATVSQDASDFIHGLLKVDPIERLTTKGALAHRWLAGHCQTPTPRLEIKDGVAGALRTYLTVSQLKEQRLDRSFSSKQLAQVREVFLAMDSDRDGVVSRQDFEVAMKGKSGLADEEIQVLFRAFDADGDGCIRYSELAAALASAKIEAHEGELRTAFCDFELPEKASSIDSESCLPHAEFVAGVVAAEMEAYKTALHAFKTSEPAETASQEVATAAATRRASPRRSSPGRLSRTFQFPSSIGDAWERAKRAI